MTFVDPQHAFEASYPSKTARFRHDLTNDPLFEIDRILKLIASVPPKSIEYNSANISHDHDPAKMPSNGLSPEETVRNIADINSWLVVMNIEQDPEYKAMMERCLADVAPHVLEKTGPMNLIQGYIFVSSPHATTPFHMDPEHNILIQIRGVKTMYTYTAQDYSMLPQEVHEAFHTTRLRNIGYKQEFEQYGTAHEMHPGDALFVPLKAPHRVQVGDEASVSLSITWRSRVSDDDAHLHKANAMLRKMGAHPPMPGIAPTRDAAKIFVHKVYSKVQPAAGG